MKRISILLLILIIGLLFKQSNAQWQLCGNFPSVAIAHNNSSIFAGGTSGGKTGVFVSNDSGATWTFDSIVSFNSSISKIVVKDMTVFAMLGNSYIYKSSNGGQSWALVITPFTAPYVMTLADTALLVGTLATFSGEPAAIYRSADYGNTWDNTLTSSLGDAVVSIASTGSEVWAASDAPSIYYSNDGGSTWTLKNNSFFPRDFSLGIACSNVLCGSPGLFLSDDSGITWKKVDTLSFGSFASGQGYSFAGWTGFYSSPDYGYTWFSNSTGLPDTGGVADITVADSIVFVSDRYAVYKRNLSELLTGINSPQLQLNYSPFPNPFTNELVLTGTSTSGNIELLNLLGGVIFKQHASNNQTLIHTVNLSSGIYVLRYMEKDNYVNFKVLKSNGR